VPKEGAHNCTGSRCGVHGHRSDSTTSTTWGHDGFVWEGGVLNDCVHVSHVSSWHCPLASINTVSTAPANKKRGLGCFPFPFTIPMAIAHSSPASFSSQFITYLMWPSDAAGGPRCAPTRPLLHSIMLSCKSSDPRTRG
jgi:hypothetical protein